jgi:hypothetical protein
MGRLIFGYCVKHGDYRYGLAEAVKNKFSCPVCAEGIMPLDGDYCDDDTSDFRGSVINSAVDFSRPLVSERFVSNVHSVPRADVVERGMLFISKAKMKRPEYDYSKVEYVNGYTQVEIVCKKHGVFKRSPNAFIHHNVICSRCKINDKVVFDGADGVCVSCGEKKPRTAVFWEKNKMVDDGLHYVCKKCRAVKVNKKQYKRDKGKINAYYRALRSSSPSYRIAMNLRVSLWGVLKRGGGKKADSVMAYIGCGIDELKVYLESKFTGEMSWDNYGKKGWHIDHIKPCASFDFTKEADLYKCFNYNNLRPCWAKENAAKSSNYNGVKYFYK